MNETIAPQNLNKILLEFAELRARLDEAESTIDAIRSGAVDALVVRGQDGDQVFTLKGADEPYRIFVEQMREGAVTLDSMGTILYCNRSFADMVGCPLERVIGSSIQQYLPPDLVSLDSETLLTRLARAETMLQYEGKGTPVLCSATPVEIDGPAAFAVTVTDLSLQKEHEFQLRRATAELEGFCYSVSHDMRAPLRSMIGAAHIVLEDFGDSLPEDGKADLRRIASSASHLGRLIDDLLTYSRLSRQEIKRHEVDLSEVAQRVADGLTRNGYADVQWQIEPGLFAQGDARLLEMTLHNLLSNAAKFSSRSTPPKIEFGRHSVRGAFFVKDNGIGFNMKYVEKLFMPFERLHRQQDYPGTGIGLANVKRIIARHDGAVWAEGEEGVGATFYFTLG